MVVPVTVAVMLVVRIMVNGCGSIVVVTVAIMVAIAVDAAETVVVFIVVMLA